MELYASVLIDRSGSMTAHALEVVTGFNGYVESLKKENVQGRLSLTFFDSQSIDLIYHAMPISDVPHLEMKDFYPRDRTPLFDAVGQAVHDIDTRIAVLSYTPRVALVIMTDGIENASTEHTAASINALLTRRQKYDGWMVMYLGANQDAWSAGSQIGTLRGQTVDYDMSRVGATMEVAANKTAVYASGGRAEPWTPAERAAAKARGK